MQVEYVEPQSQTKRGSTIDADIEQDKVEPIVAAAPPAPVGHTQKDGTVTRAATSAGTSGRTFSKFMDKQKAREGPREDSRAQTAEKSRQRPASYQVPASRTTVNDGATSGPPTRRPSKDRNGKPLVSSKPTAVASGSGETGIRPSTATSVASNQLPSRGRYSRPAPPSVDANNVQGRISMPKTSKSYQTSKPTLQPDASPEFVTSRPATQPEAQLPKGHKRANTVAGGAHTDNNRFLGKLIGSTPEKPEPGSAVDGSVHRQSIEQSRPKFEKSNSVSKPTRRFSLLPTNFSLRSMSTDNKHGRKLSRTNSRQYTEPQAPPPQVQSQPQLGAPHQDAVSALTASEVSLAAGSAPPSAFCAASIDLTTAPAKRATLSKHKKFGDAFEGEMSSGGHGSSGPARRVMDFFRRRGTARSKGSEKP